MRSTGRNTDFSLTGKLGLTSNLTLDASYNPDFSQVETDAGQIDINLRSSIYYSGEAALFPRGHGELQLRHRHGAEHRGGHRLYPLDRRSAAGAQADGKDRQPQRSFGHLRPGRVSRRPAAAEEGDSELAGRNAAFSILRYKRQLDQDSYVGGFFTDRSFAGEHNRVGGIDGRWRLNNTSYVEYSFFKSFSRALMPPPPATRGTPWACATTSATGAGTSMRASST